MRRPGDCKLGFGCGSLHTVWNCIAHGGLSNTEKLRRRIYRKFGPSRILVCSLVVADAVASKVQAQPSYYQTGCLLGMHVPCDTKGCILERIRINWDLSRLMTQHRDRTGLLTWMEVFAACFHFYARRGPRAPQRHGSALSFREFISQANLRWACPLPAFLVDIYFFVAHRHPLSGWFCSSLIQL